MTSPPRGHTASHSKYRLTCDEYDALVLRAEGRCDLCGRPYPGLVIDHDHVLGSWAVRGLLCRSCNADLGIFELPGIRIGAKKETARYLANPFRAVEPGPVRALKLDPPELWTRLAEAVGERKCGPTINELVRRYLAGEPMPPRE